jgi:hypothetical protein
MTQLEPPLATALGHFQAGRLDEAQDISRQILQRQPDNADALHLLGVLWPEVFERMAGELRAKAVPAPRATVQVPIAAGELVDRITILEIKSERIQDSEKLRNVRKELTALSQVRDRELPTTPELARISRYDIGIREPGNAECAEFAEMSQCFSPSFCSASSALSAVPHLLRVVPG